MAKDRSETRDLAESRPEIAAEPEALWNQHARRTLVHPNPEEWRRGKW